MNQHLNASTINQILVEVAELKSILTKAVDRGEHYASSSIADSVIDALSKLQSVFGDEFLIGKRLLERSTSIMEAKPLLSQLAGAEAFLQSKLQKDRSPKDSPNLNFNFINDTTLQKVILRDYEEVRKARAATCFKSTIILAGGIVEGILLFLLNRAAPDITKLKKISTKAKSEPFDQWILNDLINASLELGLIRASVDKFSHALREYRNLVHPGLEIRTNITFSEHEADISIKIIQIIHDDLSMR